MNARLRQGLVVAVFLAVLVSCSADSTESTLTTTRETTTTVATSSAAADNSRIPVIVDYSPTVSDVGGLMYLLLHPDVNVIAISLPVTGEAGCNLGLEVTMGLLAEFGQEQIPVACDDNQPDSAKQWPEDFLVGHEQLAAGLPVANTEPSELRAPDLIIEAVTASPRSVVIWAVAPLTNVARAIESQPEIVDSIERIVIMGGAVDVAGNTFSGGAEWNFAIDPEAAETVVSSGIPITLVALDATNHVPVPASYEQILAGAEQTAAISRLTAYVNDFPAVTSGFYYFWDELAATAITNPELITTESATIGVSTSGPDAGQTIRDEGGSGLTLATTVAEPGDFYTLFLSTLAGAPVSVETGATEAARAYFTGLNEAMADSAATFEEHIASGVLFGDVYDPEAVKQAIEEVFAGFAASAAQVETLQPPENLSELHQGYLAELRTLAEVREKVAEIAASVADFDALGVELEARWPGLFSSCSGLMEEAEKLGITASLPC